MEVSGVHFDDEYHIRVFDKEKYDAAVDLENRAKDFVGKIQQFSENVQQLTEVLAQGGDRIEKEKLKAIGQRNRVETEQEVIKRKQQQLQALIAEKTAELDRYIAQHNSLLAVEQEQRQLIDRLSNAD